jgi:glutamyl-tRNA synthetase
MKRPEVTRIAPSPTGALHLGNARTFLINWALARQSDWRIILRIEDLVGPRIQPAAAAGTIDILQWLGLDWDLGPLTQSHDLEPYRAAMVTLVETGRAYPSELTRSQLEAALAAPQEGVHEVPFPASLRPAAQPARFAETTPQGEPLNWRFSVPDGQVTFHDRFAGPQAAQPARTIGDFIIWTKARQPAYQLAVTVDDHRQGITQVVRGNDLLDSAARQLLLYRALGYCPEPTYTHLPLVRGPDGKRLAKRHGDTRLETYRATGVPPRRIIGLLAAWSGVLPRNQPREMELADFVERMRLSSIPLHDVVFTPEDHLWLLKHSP